MSENEKPKRDPLKVAQTYYLYPCLVYLKEKIQSGELSMEEFSERVIKNALEHGHENYKLPDDWFEQLPHFVNRYGWKIFELPKVLQKEREAAAIRREQKKQEKIAKQQAARLEKKEEPMPTVKPVVNDPSPKKKIIIVKRPVQK